MNLTKLAFVALLALILIGGIAAIDHHQINENLKVCCGPINPL